MRRVALSLVCLSACAHTSSDIDRQNAKIHHDIAVANLENHETRAALTELLRAVELDPELPEAHHALGLVYHAMGRNDDALEHYERAVAQKPGFSEARNNYGVLLLGLGRYDEAITNFKAALADILYPTPSLAEGNLGWAYYKKGEVAQGEKHVRNALAQNPKFCRGYEWLARIGLDTGKPEQVVASCRRFDKYCAKDPVIVGQIPKDYLRQMQYYLGMGYLKQGDRDAARTALTTCAAPEAEEFGIKCAQALQTLN